MNTLYQETYIHECRVSALTYHLCRELQLNSMDTQLIVSAAKSHDAGKEIIPSEVLLKPGKLTKEEYDIVKTHCRHGFDILSKKTSCTITQQVALLHHERWDGSGYPFGLQKEEIILPARIVALCDVYEAIRSKRVYKPQFTHNNTMNIIMGEKHKYDPLVLEAFTNIDIGLIDGCYRQCIPSRINL